MSAGDHSTGRRRRASAAETSAWIEGTEYTPNGDGTGALVLWLARGGGLRYDDVPAHLVGLVHAGSDKGGRRSPGHIYNLLVRGRYPYTRIEPVVAEPTSAELCDLLRRSLEEGARA